METSISSLVFSLGREALKVLDKEIAATVRKEGVFVMMEIGLGFVFSIGCKPANLWDKYLKEKSMLLRTCTAIWEEALTTPNLVKTRCDCVKAHWRPPVQKVWAFFNSNSSACVCALGDSLLGVCGVRDMSISGVWPLRLIIMDSSTTLMLLHCISSWSRLKISSAREHLNAKIPVQMGRITQSQ